MGIGVAGIALAAIAAGQGITATPRTSAVDKEGAYHVKVKFPWLATKDPVAKALVDLANREIKKEIDRQRTDFLRESAEGPPAGGAGVPYEMDLGYATGVLRPRLISVLLSTYAYTGGAHGNTGFVFKNFAMVGGKAVPLKLADLFRTRIIPREAVSRLVIAKLKKQEGATWVRDGEVKALSAEQAEQFKVTDKGLEYVFAPYEMGPYVSGPISCLLKWSELKPHLDPNGPLKGLL